MGLSWTANPRIYETTRWNRWSQFTTHGLKVKFVVVLLTELAQGPGLELVGTDEKSQSRTAWTSTEARIRATRTRRSSSEHRVSRAVMASGQEFLSNMGLIELVSVPLDFEYIRVACRSS